MIDLLANLVSLVANFSPNLAKLIPIPGLSVVQDLASSFQANKYDLSDIVAKIKASSDAQVKLQELDSQYRQYQLQWQLSMQQDSNKTQLTDDQLEAKSTEGARDFALKDPGNFEKYLAVYIISLFAFVIWFGINDMTDQNKQFVYACSIGLGYACWKVLNFFFGNDFAYRKLTDKFLK